MSDPKDQGTRHRPHPQPSASAYLEFDLSREIEHNQSDRLGRQCPERHADANLPTTLLASNAITP
jgi:hypothetical protein